MKYTDKLGLPIWNKPETDEFNIQHFNKGMQAIDDIVINILNQINDLAIGDTNIDLNGYIKEEVFKEYAKEVEQISSQLYTKANKIDVNSKVWSMANMGQDVKEAMTGGSVAVIGKNTVLTENIVDNQVTVNKANFIKYGKNLFNKANVIYDKQITDNTGLKYGDSNSKNLSDLITTVGGATYTFSAFHLSGGVTVFEMTSDKKAVKNTLILPSEIVDNSMTFTLNENTAIIRLQFSNELNLDTIQLEMNTTKTSYEEYCLIIDNFKNKKIEENRENISINSSNISKLSSDVDALKIANGLSIDIVRNRKFNYSIFDDKLFVLSEQTDKSSIVNGKEYKSIIAPN